MRRTSEGRTAAVSKAHQSAEGSSGSGDTGALQRRPSVEVESATREPDWCHRSHPPSPPPGARFTTGEPAPRRRRPRVAAVDGCGVEAEAWQRRGPGARKRPAGMRRVAATIGAGRGSRRAETRAQRRLRKIRTRGGAELVRLAVELERLARAGPRDATADPGLWVGFGFCVRLNAELQKDVLLLALCNWCSNSSDCISISWASYCLQK
jgi:hypothetical protein